MLLKSDKPINQVIRKKLANHINTLIIIIDYIKKDYYKIWEHQISEKVISILK